MGIMTNYPVFSSRHSIGLTFLSWSYHWLAGHETFWNSKLGFCKIPHNPNTGINAHFFRKNCCIGFQEWSNFLLNDQNNLENCSMYGAGTYTDNLLESNQDYALCLKFASKINPLIFFVESSSDPWYFLCKRHIHPDRTTNQNLSLETLDSFQNSFLTDFLKTYFHDSLSKIDKNIWDLRELIALNFNYFKVDDTYLKEVDRTIDHLYVDSKELWYNGEECLRRIFKYLDKTIVDERVPHWRDVYREWQSIQIKILQFNWYLPIIVDAIVNNYNFDLDFLNLTLVQEGVIQGHLIKDHNLNLKCYGFEKFPSNTRDLHLLLKKNIHV
jgi:hypothetical protein